MKKILIVEDNLDIACLLTKVIGIVGDADIKHAIQDDDAIPLIEWADLVISDFNYPAQGFLGILPELQRTQRQFILQSADLENIRHVYDQRLQIAAILKGADYVHQMISILDDILVQS